MPPEAEELLVGKQLAGRYEMLSLVGKGGIGVVYKARHLFMNKMVAIKLLKRALISDNITLMRFQQEAKTASSINHPNVITVHDFGITDDGIPYLVMDFLEGISLGDVIREEGAVDPERAIPIFTQTCAGIHHAHLQGIIHRDVKPSNIMLCSGPSGETVKIVDFGMAKLLPFGNNESLSLTASGDVLGSPLYMSPEQCTGDSLDVRSDIYSMGCTMYEALTGCPPLSGKNAMETMYKHLREMPLTFDRIRPDLKIPSQLEAIVFRTLEKDPRKRFQTMDELRIALEAIDLHRASHILNLLSRTSRKLRREFQQRKPVAIAAVAFLIAAIASPLVLFGLGMRQTDEVLVRELGNTAGNEEKLAALSLQLNGQNDDRVYEQMSHLLSKQAALYLEQGRYKDAETVFKEAEESSRKSLEMRRKRLGEDHPEVTGHISKHLEMLDQHEESLRRLGKVTEAERLEERARDFRSEYDESSR